MKLFANKAALHRKQEQAKAAADKSKTEPTSKANSTIPSIAPSPRNSAQASKKVKPELCKTVVSKGPTRTFTKPTPQLGAKKISVSKAVLSNFNPCRSKRNSTDLENSALMTVNSTGNLQKTMKPIKRNVNLFPSVSAKQIGSLNPRSLPRD